MVPKHIQEEAQYYLKKAISLSSNSMSTEEFLDNMKDLNNSSIRQNKEVFSCIMNELLDEWTFFPGYSRNILIKYADVLGGIIEYDLIPNPKALSEVLQFVLDSLNSRPSSKMFDFGIMALNRFHECLRNRGQFFESVIAIPHFKNFPPHLIKSIEDYRKCNFAEYLYEEATDVQQSSVSVSPTTTRAVDTWSVDLEEYDFEEVDWSPTDEDKIAFIVNNLSANNLREKCDEIKGIMRDEHVQWFSEYLLEKRVRFEFNLHSLYSDLLDQIGNEELDVLIISKTLENIRSLLDSGAMDNRAELKNLGHWLGIMTLAKNKPLPFYNGYLNSLIIKAYGKGNEGLMYIIPFIAKILMSSAKSHVFEPKSPWTLSILKTLAELHKLPDLKLNVQFEIEILCKSLNIGLEDLKYGQC